MRPVLKNLGKLTLQLFSVFLIIVACGKDDGPEVNDPTPKTNPDNPDGVVQDSVANDSVPIFDVNSADPNLVTQSLILDNMKIIEGELPTGNITAKSMPIDFKIDSDTIFWAPGITKRIKIRSPQGIVITGVWIYIEGSHSYIEADFREDEASTDEEGNKINILYFQFDPTNWDLPVSFPIRIIPLGPGGEPQTPTGPPPGGDPTGLAEKPHDHGTSSCDWKITEEQYWRWQSFEDKASGVEALAFAPTFTVGSTFGSCDPNGLGPCEQGVDDESVELNYTNFSYIANVYFKLFPDGHYVVEENVYFNNLDICNSSFCGDTPTAAYSSHKSWISGAGTWSIRADCTLQLTPEGFDYDADNDGIPASPMIGGGPFVQFKMTSDHSLEETLIASSDLPDGLGGSVEKYELTQFGQGIDFLIEELYWRDLYPETSDNSSK